jgi:hypothetical protein
MPEAARGLAGTGAGPLAEARRRLAARLEEAYQAFLRDPRRPTIRVLPS